MEAQNITVPKEGRFEGGNVIKMNEDRERTEDSADYSHLSK